MPCARIGRHAATKEAPRVHTTREGLEPGQQYQFDDMWHNTMVIWPGHAKAVRPLELACLDVASAHKVAYGLKPRLEREDGTRMSLAESDMRFLLANVLCNIGYHPAGCTLFVEGGTAAIRAPLERILQTLSGGKIEVSRSGVDRTTMLGKWGYENKGNPDHKSYIESSHNVAQNALDHLPGYMGSNSRVDKPEDFDAMIRHINKELAAQVKLSPELIERLKFPILDFATFEEVVAEVYEQISARREHSLEGWARHTTRQWRGSSVDVWHSEEEFHALSAPERAALMQLIQLPGYARVAKKSRREVWDAGVPALVSLPRHAAAIICGPDLAKEMPCPAGDFAVRDREISAEPLRYRLSECVAPDGSRVILAEGRRYRWLVNPFNTSAMFVMAPDGSYLGECPRIATPCRTDTAAIGEEIGKSRRDLAESLAPYQRRQSAAAAAQLKQLNSNAAVFREGAAALEAARQTTERRRAEAAPYSLGDLAPALAAQGETEAAPAEEATTAATLADLM